MINFILAILVGLYFFMTINFPDQEFSKLIISILMGFAIYLFLEAHFYRLRKIEYVEATYDEDI